MAAISSQLQCLDYITCPWNYEGTTVQKVTVWAAFCFVGWMWYPAQAVVNCYHYLERMYQWIRGKVINSGIEEIFFSDPISQGLFNFNNSNENGQINGIYITSNETNQPLTNQFFEQHPRPSEDIQTIHVGCATWHNLDIICKRRSTYGLIVDFNSQNARFMRKTIELINSSASRDIFQQSMTNYLHSLTGREREFFFHQDQQGQPTERIERELLRADSWLGSEENYRYIKEQMVDNDRLIAITENITNSETFLNIKRYLNRNQIAIDTLYLSNICNFMNTASTRTLFIRSVRHLLTENTIFINCPRIRERNSSDITLLQQRAILGRDILADTFSTIQLFEEIIPFH